MGKRNICQTTGKSKTDDSNTANHRRAQNDNRERKGLSGVLRIASLIAVFLEEYSWGIRGVFVGYSWDIRMYRVCVGYVSGMYRERVEGDGAREGLWMAQKKEGGVNDNIDNLRPNQ